MRPLPFLALSTLFSLTGPRFLNPSRNFIQSWLCQYQSTLIGTICNSKLIRLPLSHITINTPVRPFVMWVMVRMWLLGKEPQPAMCNSDDFFPSIARYVRKFHSSACQVKIHDYADFLLPIVFDKSVLKLQFVNVERVHTFIEHAKKSLPIVLAYISSGPRDETKTWRHLNISVLAITHILLTWLLVQLLSNHAFVVLPGQCRYLQLYQIFYGNLSKLSSPKKWRKSVFVHLYYLCTFSSFVWSEVIYVIIFVVSCAN